MSRSFSELEQRIINSLLDLDSKNGLNVIGNFVGEYLQDSYFIRVDSEKKVTLMLKEEYLCQTDINKLNGGLSDFFITLIMLFDFLKSERYIYFSGDYEFKTLGLEFVGEKYVSCNIIDDDIKNLVHKYTTQKFFITESFKEFVRNDYKTKEEVVKEKELDLSSKELRYTRLALAVTFIGLIASVLVPLLSTTSVKLENDIINTSTSKETIKVINEKLNAYNAVNHDMLEKTNQSIGTLNTKIERALLSIENISELDIKKIKGDLRKIKFELSNVNLIVNDFIEEKTDKSKSK